MNKKILIIDDEVDLVEMLGLRLRAAGFETIEAQNGPKGLEEARSSPPDLILLDLMMPVMDGFEVARSLQEDERTREIPLIALTAMVYPALEELLKKIGAVACVTKPFEAEDLVALIQKVLKGEK